MGKKKKIENEVVEEVQDEVVEDVQEEFDEIHKEMLLDLEDDGFGDVEERIIDIDDEEQRVELHNFDCDDYLELMNERNEIAAQTNMLAGEIARRKLVLNKLIAKEEAVYIKMGEKRVQIKERYNLGSDYKWNIDIYEGVAVGVKKV